MKLQILVGPIAAGKSTYSLSAARQGVLCVNDDSIVNMLHANDYTLYNTNLKILYKSIENHIICMGTSMGKIVLVDRGLNCSLQGRKRWLAIANSFDIPCEAIVFKNDGPEVHAQRRFESDSRGHSIEYWKRVANIHNKAYSEPTLEEGFSAVHKISFDEIKSGKVII